MRKFIIAAVILLLLTNVVVLAGVAYNRSGAPQVSIELTERELPIQQSFGATDENSGTALSVEWKMFDPDADPKYIPSSYETSPWLNDAKLIELGFDIEKLKRNIDRYQYRTSHLTIEAILVLEYDGQTYREALALAESRAEALRNEVNDNPDDVNLATRYKNYSEQLTRLKQSRSRLYIIDAGHDIQTLIQKYADNDNYLFLRGEIGLRWNEDVIKGNIRQLSIQKLHIPLPFSQLLSGLAGEHRYYPYKTTSIPPRYTVKLNIGNRLEPWIESVTLNENVEEPGQ